VIKNILIVVALLLLGVGAGITVDRTILQARPLQSLFSESHQVRQGGFSLINPLLECEIGGERLSKQFVTFRYQIEAEVNKLKSSGQVENMSVYFRDLNNGLGFGINEKEGFTPASLLKLPVMIAYFKQSEVDSSILKKTYTYTDLEDRNRQEHVKPRDPIIKGETYTVEDLITKMIAFSDNNAMALLVENLPLSTQDKVYNDLGITIPGLRGSDDYMSVSDYASFFRILFNASYLSKDNSQKALSLLTKVDFSDGLRAGVPKGVEIANKFGERETGTTDQLHDCGIVYFNDHPYLLCIMSRGTDFNKLASSIKDISHLVYSEVDKQEKL
jgi:beta-lactamase class A